MSPAGKPKHIILDTNCLLHSADALLSFQDNRVILAVGVLRELDRFKRDGGELGANSRAASRILDQLRQVGRLTDGVPLPNGGQLRVVLPQNGKAALSVDEELIALAKELMTLEPDTPSILVSKDINVRILADAYGVRAEDYKTDHVRLGDLYTGTSELSVAPEDFAAFRANGKLDLNGTGPYCPNQYCCVTNAGAPKQSLLARVDGSGHVLVPLRNGEPIWGVKARNREQRYCLDALCRPEISLVTLTGSAGTGKTLLALAAGLQQVLGSREYRRLVVARPTVPMGRDLGFLPGSVEDKIGPYMLPVQDALDMLEDLGGGRQQGQGFDELIRRGTIELQALSYIRGRSLAGAFILIDEAQNLTPLEAKTIVTRVAQSSKIVFSGDLSQIDCPYIDWSSSGLSHLVSKFRGQAIAAHVELAKSERGDLAELGATLLSATDN